VICLALLASCVVAPTSPLDIARAEVARSGRSANVRLSVDPKVGKECFKLTGDGKTVRIVAGDAVGAMYGAYEFSERLKLDPKAVWKAKVDAKPYLQERGLNLFLTLPWDYKKNDTDYDVAALTDPNRWWFANEDYWTTLLDLMAKSRLNWLDIHGGWDISVTNAPNMYAYFVTSPSFPMVGVAADVKAKNLRQLNHVVEMAHSRGIRVSLMCYEANLKIPQNPNPPYQATEANVYKYTKEVVEKMIRGVPGLDAIGYRIGESGRSEDFFKCYDEAIRASGRDIPIITRSWITRKQKVLPLARASKDFTVEIKYNGEQWGAPYIVAGGRMSKWGSYSYEDYLSDSGQKGVKTWPGWEAEGGGQWPSQPYKVVWQVRANGTHRIFPFYNPDWVRRTIGCMKMGTASGYTIEGLDAYYPKSPDYYLANSKDKYCDWIHQRDEMYWMTWGRLGYDPKTPDAVFDKRASETLGKGTEELLKEWKWASALIATNYVADAIGPDHRDHAPELEWGGGPGDLIPRGGLDSFLFSPINEEYANRATGAGDGRYSTELLTLYDVLQGMKAGAFDTYSDDKGSDPFSQYKGHAKEIAMSNASAIWQAGQQLDWRSIAYTSAQYQATFGREFNPFPADPRMPGGQDVNARGFAYYKPFTERLRMHTNTFSWKNETAKSEAETKRLAQLPRPPRTVDAAIQNASDDWAVEVVERQKPVAVKWTAAGKDVVVRVEALSADHGYLLWKPLPSSTTWHRVPMKRQGKVFTARVARPLCGLQIAAELRKGTSAVRVPAANKGTPYLVIPSQPGPTPQIYAADEAMRFLKPAVLDPAKYGGMLIGSRSGQFFRSFDRATKRKLLEPVQKGLRLLILQEDFTKDKLDFLPKSLKIENAQSDTFDPGGQLGLEKATAPGMMWHRFAPSEGWEVFGNGGLARLKIGKGEVWVTTARLMQNMHYPTAAKAFVRLLSLGGKTKPTVVIDAASEGGPFTSSCHEDLMNSHDIPFLTLGEVIAKEQGMDSFTPVPGPTSYDDVLGGKGTAMANAFLKSQVVTLSKRPTPATVSAFEEVRKFRKKELMRSLGLDPIPPKTPLNARITGTIPGLGYHIEKLVFESRPKFYVTAHVYVPDGLRASQKLPVVVNVNGHWAHKKDEDRIQLRCQFQALRGYIAVAIDSPGWSFEGDSLIERRPEGNHNDWSLFQATNTTGYYVWDAIRALDYMATRADTDMSKIGITGASGGGLATLYTFAADDRYTCAVPVVYMASLELAPDNGCLCNHVPGTCQIGDRSDVMAIQAPKPVYIMGAQTDGEFPPDATNLTVSKLRATWNLFGRDGDVYGQIYAGGHDYNQLMRESSIGFFDKYLRGVGTGAPVAQPALTAIDPEDRRLLALDPLPKDERTMRDLSREYLDHAPASVSVEEAIKVNGGRPAVTPLKYKETGTGMVRTVTFEPEPGLVTPGVLYLPGDKVDGVDIYVADAGKAAAIERAGTPKPGGARLYIDALGTGELAGIELRYPVYAGRSVAFSAGWQIVRAAEAMRKYSPHIGVYGTGPMSSQAVMWAGLLDPAFERIVGYDCMKSWLDAFGAGFPPMTVQPRAHLCGSLENLRMRVKHGTWSY